MNRLRYALPLFHVAVFLLLLIDSFYYADLNRLLKNEISVYGRNVHANEIALKRQGKEKFNHIAAEFLETAPSRLITIKTPADVEKKRKRLIFFIWGSEKLPQNQPTSVVKNSGAFSAGAFAAPFLKQCDTLTIGMEHGITSNVFLLFPTQPNQRLVLFHQGHSDDIYDLEKGMRACLKRGYTVGLLFMPTTGPNNRPVIPSKEFGPLEIGNHQSLSLIDCEKGHPLKFFIEPVIVTLNYIDKNYKYVSSAMTGLSGGGWTTVLAAALDNRIDASFPVAGANPLFLRADETLGDFEQSTPDFYNDLDYTDLFLMGSYGQGRSQLRIYNRYDSCCFFGVKSALVQHALDQALKTLGAGRSRLFIDDSSIIHTYSYRAVREMLSMLSRSEAGS